MVYVKIALPICIVLLLLEGLVDGFASYLVVTKIGCMTDLSTEEVSFRNSPEFIFTVLIKEQKFAHFFPSLDYYEQRGEKSRRFRFSKNASSCYSRW